MVGFTGSRKLSAAQSVQVEQVAQAIGAMGLPVAVGCAQGADQIVRAAIPSAQVFRVAGSQRYHFAKRSVELVAAVWHSEGRRFFVAFPAGPCPAGLVPSPSSSACFCGKGSGTWATAAYAAGVGLPVVVFGDPVNLPVWPGGSWSLITSGPLKGGSVFRVSQVRFF